MKPYWTTAQAAAHLGFSRKTIEAWCRSSKIRSIRPAGPTGDYRIPHAEILRLQAPPLPFPKPQPPDDDWDAISRNLNLERRR